MAFLFLSFSVCKELQVDGISVSISAPNVDKCALSADIRFRLKAAVSHSVHFQFRWAAVGKFGGCQKYVTEPECTR